MRIGELARLTGVGIDTIRYYERRQLLGVPHRKASGYRQFSATDVSRMQFILRARGLGFTLTEIKDLLGLWFDARATCCDVRRVAQQKIDELDQRIAQMRQMKRSLQKLIGECQNRGSLVECPLLEGLPEDPSRNACPKDAPEGENT